MAAPYTRTAHVSRFERVGSAIKGVLVGFLFFVVSFPLRTVERTEFRHRARHND